MGNLHELILRAVLPCLMLITVIALLVHRRKLSSAMYRVLQVYLIVNVGIETIAGIRDIFFDLATDIVYNSAIVYEPSAFILIFYLVELSSVWRNRIIGALIIFLAFASVNYFFMQGPDILNSYTYILASFFLTILSIRQLTTFIVGNLNKEPFSQFMFWFTVGVLFCYLGNLPLLAFYGFLSESDKFRDIFLIVSISVNAILFVTITTGLICHRPANN